MTTPLTVRKVNAHFRGFAVGRLRVGFGLLIGLLWPGFRVRHLEFIRAFALDRHPLNSWSQLAQLIPHLLTHAHSGIDAELDEFLIRRRRSGNSSFR
jgi:hypothetical protein